MLAITRFVKKDKLFDLIQDPNIGKFEIQTSLNKSLNDDTVVKTRVYLRIPKLEFLNFIGMYLLKGREEKNNTVVTTLLSAKRDNFLKASAFDDFGKGYKPSKTMIEFMNKYTQEYFYNL